MEKKIVMSVKNLQKPVFAPVLDNNYPNLTDGIPEILIVSPNYLNQIYEPLISEFSAKANIQIVNDDLESIKANIDNKDAIISCPRPLFEKVFDNLKSLKWVHVGGAGVEDYMFNKFIMSNIILTNGKIIQGPECADHALALLLSLTRRINLVVKGTAKKELPRPLELYNKKAVIFGLGGIGMGIAERAKAFGMKIYGVDQDYKPFHSMFEKIIQPNDLRQVLSDADVFFMAAPHTGNTQDFIDHKYFKAMQKKPIFISVSRGATTNINDLTKAVEEGILSGVGIDVSNPEPLPEDHPLRGYDNVLITPHIAGLSDQNRNRSIEVIRINISNFIEGIPLINVVDKQLGY